jgi:hypothetical protein
MMLIKLSLGIFFLRIVMGKWERRLIILMISLSWLVGLGYSFYATFECGIPNGGGVPFWLARITGECNSTTAQIAGTSYTQGAINMLTDIVLLLVPIPTLRASQIPRREKFIVVGILAIATW